jgi:hypothetical protein
VIVMGKLLFFPRKQQEPKPNYLLGSLVFLGIIGFCLASWTGAYHAVVALLP